MKWKQFLTPVRSMNVEEARHYVSEHQEGTITLLDVRQPKEYEQERIPGATLMPLPELLNRFHELDSEKPVIVYCAMGGRSRVAAQMLAGQGFQEVYNLKGGIQAWQGVKAAGPEEPERALFDPKAEPDEVLALAYGLEEGLASLYRELAMRTADQETKSTLLYLADFEMRHKERVLELYGLYHQSVPDAGLFERAVLREEREGGWSTEEFLAEHEGMLQSDAQVISMAMMIEAQALDLYHRYSQKSRSQATEECFRQLAEEEKSHLRKLGELLGNKV
jgi:sulfur-carrier protein adenylyltransferase/sulfurtransferase